MLAAKAGYRPDVTSPTREILDGTGPLPTVAPAAGAQSDQAGGAQTGHAQGHADRGRRRVSEARVEGEASEANPRQPWAGLRVRPAL